MRTAGVVLAGGLSRRFGSPKAFAQLKGRAFYEYAVQALTPHCDHIIIVARPEFADQFPKEYQVIGDDERFQGEGPLAGIYSAMKAYEAERYMVLPCDMPYIQAEFMRQLLTAPNADVVSVKTDDYHHPLVSLWNRSVMDKLESILIEKELRVVPFLETLNTTWIHVEESENNASIALRNINRQGDLERGEE